MSRRRHVWTAQEMRELRRRYPHERTTDIARRLGHPVASVYAKANAMGLHKSASFLATDKSGRIFVGGRLGKEHQFKAGHVTWNKGTHWTAGGRSAETRFKKGRPAHEAANYKPVGSMRITGGVLEQKVTDDPSIYPARRWRPVARLVWEAANGPIPSGHAVVFKHGQQTVVREEITLDRLELLSRAELMKRNTLHRYPKDIALAIQLRGALMRQINKRTKNRSKHEDEDQRPA